MKPALPNGVYLYTGNDYTGSMFYTTFGGSAYPGGQSINSYKMINPPITGGGYRLAFTNGNGTNYFQNISTVPNFSQTQWWGAISPYLYNVSRVDYQGM